MRKQRRTVRVNIVADIDEVPAETVQGMETRLDLIPYWKLSLKIIPSASLKHQEKAYSALLTQFNSPHSNSMEPIFARFIKNQLEICKTSLP